MLLLAPRFSISRSLCPRQVRITAIQLRSVTPIATRALSVTTPKRDKGPSPLSNIEHQPLSKAATSSSPLELYIRQSVHEEIIKKMESEKRPKVDPKKYSVDPEEHNTKLFCQILKAAVALVALTNVQNIAKWTLQVWHAAKVKSVQEEIRMMEERVYTRATKSIAVYNGNLITVWKGLRFVVSFGVFVFFVAHAAIIGAGLGIAIKLFWTITRMRLGYLPPGLL